MSNREKRVEINHVHLYLALSRPSQGEKADCIRTIDKGGEVRCRRTVGSTQERPGEGY